MRRVKRWDYWSAPSLHHLYADVFAGMREDPLHDWMLQQVAQWWQRGPITPIGGCNASA